jgi:hypothetical protein
MSVLTPLRVPPLLRLRLTQVGTALATTLATVWLCRLGPIPGIIGVLFAKHILVAILLMGLGMGDVRPGRNDSRMR